jgi:hypothetical protein
MEVSCEDVLVREHNNRERRREWPGYAEAEWFRDVGGEDIHAYNTTKVSLNHCVIDTSLSPSLSIIIIIAMNRDGVGIFLLSSFGWGISLPQFGCFCTSATSVAAAS